MTFLYVRRLEMDEDWSNRFSLWADIMEHVSQHDDNLLSPKKTVFAQIRRYRRFLSDKPPLLEKEVTSLLHDSRFSISASDGEEEDIDTGANVSTTFKNGGWGWRREKKVK